MKKVDIDESGTLYWKISIKQNRRQELADLLVKQDVVSWVTIQTAVKDVVACGISNMAEKCDLVALRELIEGFADEESE